MMFDADKTRMTGLPYRETSSPAVAKRPCDASCLSVSFNSTKGRVQSFIVSYAGYRFIIVQLRVIGKRVKMYTVSVNNVLYTIQVLFQLCMLCIIIWHINSDRHAVYRQRKNHVFSIYIF